jgi:hypothetical protein
MTIPPTDESQLIVYTAEYIKNLRISRISGNLLRHSGNEALSKPQLHQQTVDRAVKYCGEGGYDDFIRGWITRQLAISRKNGLKSLNIVEALGRKDALSISREIVDYFKSLPEKLILSMRLPDCLSKYVLAGIDNYELGDGVWLRSGDFLTNSLVTSSGLPQLDKAILRNLSATEIIFHKKSHYLVKYTSGFVGHFVNNTAARELADSMRSLLGLLLSENVLEFGFAETDNDWNGISIFLNSGQQNSNLCYAEPVDSDLVQFYNNYECTLEYMRPSFEEFTDEDDDPVTETADEKDEKLQDEIIKFETRSRNLLNRISKCFQKNDHARKIQLAGIWLYRSMQNSRVLDSILEATVSLEVLLGDRDMADRVGLTKLLANRCAYLIGTTQSERSKLIDDFQKVYRLRSEIVHAGLHRVTSEMNEANKIAKLLAQKVISKEIDLS